MNNNFIYLRLLLAIICLFTCKPIVAKEESLMSNYNFTIDSWNELTTWENNNEKMTRATVSKTFTGKLVGKSQLEYVLNYTADGNASFVGIERVTATIDNKTGSFSVQHQGKFIDGIASSTFVVFTNSATDELIGLNGKGSYTSGHAPSIDFEFNYAFD